MSTLPVKIAVAVVSIGMMLSGCREVVSHPIPPLAARAQVSTLPATSSLPYTAGDRGDVQLRIV